MPEQKPSVGHVVHYRSYGTPGGEYEPECRAAIITKVGEDGAVSLTVMNPEGFFFNQNVPQGNPDDRGTWHWPERV